MGGARDGLHAQAGLCRAAHHRPTPTMCDPLENQSTTARSAPATLSATRMPNVAARAAAAWRPCRSHALTTGLAAQRPKTHVAPGGGGMRSGQPRCARGNLKAVAEGDNEDDEGEVRSEGSGPQSWAPIPQTRRTRGDLRRTNPANQPPRNKGRVPSHAATSQSPGRPTKKKRPTKRRLSQKEDLRQRPRQQLNPAPRNPAR